MEVEEKHQIVILIIASFLEYGLINYSDTEF